MKLPNKVIGVLCATCIAVSGYVFSKRSELNLAEVDPRLQAVSHCALTHSVVDFVVIDGGRTAAEHKTNVANGKSWIKRSKHQDGLAVDVAAFVNGRVTYEAAPYYKIADAYYACSNALGTPITWGGEWKAKDLMHFELKQ